MILVISRDYDQSTSDVVEWLLKFKEKFILINEYNYIKNISYFQTQERARVTIETSLNEKINFSDLNSIWYRRGNFYYSQTSRENKLKDFLDHDKKEWQIVNELLMQNLNEKFIIGDFFNKDTNKIKVLKVAAKKGLLIPSTLIANNKALVVKFFKNEKIINKTIGNVIHLNKDNYVYNNRTVEINVDDLPDNFFPSQFQKLIEKKYELRIFYINGKFFSSAIFSQNNEKTKIDFRNYDNKKPNRVVPYTLPKKIEIKLEKLMQELKLNTGSIDIMVTPNNDFYFLEVNPVGQFGMVSIPCNYNCEKYLAETLIDNK